MSTSSTVEPDYSDEQRDSVADAMLGMVDRSEAERQEVYNWVRRKMVFGLDITRASFS